MASIPDITIKFDEEYFKALEKLSEKITVLEGQMDRVITYLTGVKHENTIEERVNDHQTMTPEEFNKKYYGEFEPVKPKINIDYKGDPKEIAETLRKEFRK